MKNIRHKFICFHTICTRMTVNFVTVFLIVLAFMGISIYLFTGRVLEKRNEQSYQKVLEAADEILNDKVNSYSGMARMLLGNEAVQRALQMEDPSSERTMNPVRWQMLNEIGSTYIYNLKDLIGIYIFDNDGKYYYQEPGRTSYEAECNTKYEQIRSSAWYRQAIAAQGKEIIFGYDVLQSSDNIISCVKVLNKLNSTDKIGLLVVQINKNTMQNVIGQFPTENDIYVLENQDQIVYQNGYNVETFHESLENILNNRDEKYLITSFASCQDGWRLIHAVRKEDVFSEADQLRNIILIVTVIALILTVLLCITESKAITRPLLQLRDDIARVGHGKRTFHHSYGNDEVGVIGTEFQNMVMKELELKERIAQEEILRKDSQLQLLQSQINPHFLYNTLDTLYWMALEEGADKVADLTQSLSEVFKISLSEGVEFITIRDEIRFIEDYLHIQNVRFEGKFLVQILVDEELMDMYILKQILQPFVENAIYHGLEPKIEKGHITVTGTCDENMLVFTVEDDGVGIAAGVDVMKGYAVSNVQQRMRLHYGEKAEIRFYSQKDQGTTVKITLPFREVKNAEDCVTR